MKLLFLLVIVGIILSADHAFATNKKTDTSGRHILILNAYDPSGSKFRKNKKELFTELADSLKEYLHGFLFAPNKLKNTIIPELLKDTSSGNMESIINQHKATMALVITNLNVYFEQTDVEVAKDWDGKKTRKAFYDICCTVTYSIFSLGFTTMTSEEKNCEFFTRRTVVSGVLAAGPDVVGKKKHTYDMVKENALKFLNRNGYLFE